MTYDDVVKSFEVSSVSFVSSGNSLNIKAERRVAKTKTLATLLLNWTGIPDTKRQQPVTSRLKSKHLVDTMSCQTPMIVYDVPRVVAVTKIAFIESLAYEPCASNYRCLGKSLPARVSFVSGLAPDLSALIARYLVDFVKPWRQPRSRP